MTIEPNIFDYATSELSQDAFICYLLSFGKKEFNGSKEYIAAHKFLRECGIEEDVKEIHTQYKHIDVLVETGNYLLIIEDKTYTNEHGDQILHYIKTLQDDNELNNKSNPKKIIACYLKTSDFLHKYEPDKNKMKDLELKEDDFKYLSLKREDVMSFIKESEDFIFQSFYTHLENLYNNNCDENDLSTWDKSNWFKYLEKLFNDKGIIKEEKCNINGYVPNASGGFYATHFNWKDLSEDMQLGESGQYKAGTYNQLELFFSDGKTCRINLAHRFHSGKWDKEETKEYKEKGILKKLQDKIKTEGYKNQNKMGASTAYKIISYGNHKRAYMPINKETSDKIKNAIEEFIKNPS